MSGTFGGVRALSSGLVDSVVALFAQPLFAAILGFGTGLGLFYISRHSFEAINDEDPSRGILLGGLSLVGRLAFATLVMYLYHRFVPAGFPAFGLTFAGTFLVLYTVELVRYAGLHRYARPTAGSRDGR